MVPDLQGGEVREKVISNKETHEHPVINGPLRGRWRGGEVKKDKGMGRGGKEEVEDAYNV